MRTLPISINHDQLAELCRQHGIVELSLFGSVLRDDFRPDSDVDVLITFEPGKTLTLDSYADISDELSTLFDARNVDLVESGRLVDPYRRHEILRTCESLYVR